MRKENFNSLKKDFLFLRKHQAGEDLLNLLIALEDESLSALLNGKEMDEMRGALRTLKTIFDFIKEN